MDIRIFQTVIHLGKTELIIGILGLIVTATGLILYLYHRAKDKTESAELLRIEEKRYEEQTEKADEIISKIDELGRKHQLYLDSLPKAPVAVRDPYHEGLSALDRRDFVKAEIKLTQALENTRNYEMRGAIHQSLGFLYFEKRDLEKAHFQYDKALKAAEYAGDHRGKIWAFNGLGLVEKDLENYESALAYYDKGLAVTERENDDFGKATLLGNKGAALILSGAPDKGLENCKESQVIFLQLDYQLGIARNLGNIGIAKLGKDDLDGALDSFVQSLKIAKSIGYSVGEVRQLCNIGSVYIAKGEPEKALPYLFEGLEKAEKLNTPVELENIKALIEEAEKLRADEG